MLFFPKVIIKIRMFILYTSIQYYAGGPSKYNESRKRTKGIKNVKEEDKLPQKT